MAEQKKKLWSEDGERVAIVWQRGATVWIEIVTSRGTQTGATSAHESMALSNEWVEHLERSLMNRGWLTAEPKRVIDARSKVNPPLKGSCLQCGGPAAAGTSTCEPCVKPALERERREAAARRSAAAARREEIDPLFEQLLRR
jgi:hypothetical protein